MNHRKISETFQGEVAAEMNISEFIFYNLIKDRRIPENIEEN
jgi:hypothetical protein